MTPKRILDTRQTGTPLSPGSRTRVQVGGIPGVSPEARAAVVNLTVIGRDVAGFATAWKGGDEPRPETSNVNWSSVGIPVANVAIVELDGFQGFAIESTRGSADLVVDLQAYVTVTGEVVA